MIDILAIGTSKSQPTHCYIIMTSFHNAVMSSCDIEEKLYGFAMNLFDLKLYVTTTNQMRTGKLHIWLGTMNLFLFKILDPPSKDELSIWKAERKRFIITHVCMPYSFKPFPLSLY